MSRSGTDGSEAKKAAGPRTDPAKVTRAELLAVADHREFLLSRLEEVEDDLGRSSRTEAVAKTTGAEGKPGQEMTRLRSILADETRGPDGTRDALATRLMELYRTRKSKAAFGLLFELARETLLHQVAARLRRYGSKVDPNDVLQEVFVNIYRYPHRFDATREDAFRVWSSKIVRNTVLKHLRSLSRGGRVEVAFEDLPEPSQPSGAGPLSGAIESESSQECRRVLVTYLHLYLQFYGMLSKREQRAIHLVEVDGRSYREAAAELEIKLENLKMVIFRARRKIHRSMRRVFEGLPPDVKPARDPRPADSLTAGREEQGGSR